MKNYKLFHLTKEVGGIRWEVPSSGIWLKEGLNLGEIPLPCQVEYQRDEKRLFSYDVLEKWAAQRTFSKNRENMQEIMEINDVVPAKWWEMFFHYEGRWLHDGFWLQEGEQSQEEERTDVAKDSYSSALYPSLNKPIEKIQDPREVLCLMQYENFEDYFKKNEKRVFIGFLIKEEDRYRWIPSKEIKERKNIYRYNFFKKWTGLSMDFPVTSLELFGFFKQRLPRRVRRAFFQEHLESIGLDEYEPWSYMKKTGLGQGTDHLILLPYEDIKEQMNEHLWRVKE